MLIIFFQLKARAVTAWRHSGDHGGELSVFCWWSITWYFANAGIILCYIVVVSNEWDSSLNNPKVFFNFIESFTSVLLVAVLLLKILNFADVGRGSGFCLEALIVLMTVILFFVIVTIDYVTCIIISNIKEFFLS